MPKDKVEEPKKKMVVVEEVAVEESPIEEQPIEKSTPVEEPKAEKQEVIVEPIEEESEKSNYLWIIIPTALLVGALVGGLITYFSGISKFSSVAPTPSPVATTESVSEVTPTATPSSTVKREDLKVQILNGSGISGEAGKAKTLLEGLGYKNIDTGNASSSDFVQTEIAIKAASKDALATVIKDLSTKYTAVEASKALATTSKYDIVITIGKK